MDQQNNKINEMLFDDIHERLNVIEKILNIDQSKNEKTIEYTKNPSIQNGMFVIIKGKRMSGKTTLMGDLIEEIGNRYREVYSDVGSISHKSLVYTDNLKSVCDYNLKEIIIELINKQEIIKQTSGGVISEKDHVLIALDDFDDLSINNLMEQMKSCGIDLVISCQDYQYVNLNNKYFDLMVQYVENDTEDDDDDNYDPKVYTDVSNFINKKSKFYKRSQFKQIIASSVKKCNSWLFVFKKEGNVSLELYQSKHQCF